MFVGTLDVLKSFKKRVPVHQTELRDTSREGEVLLDYAQRYSHAIDWSTLDHARAMLEESGAFGAGEDSKLQDNWRKWKKSR
jgi:hypothetical protein